MLPQSFVSTLRQPVIRHQTKLLRSCGGSCRELSRGSMSSGDHFPATPYEPKSASWPYSAADFSRQDESADTVFYAPSRLVTHIDDNAIATLSRYYATILPREGKILEICSSWLSHFPTEHFDAAKRGATDPIGLEDTGDVATSTTGTANDQGREGATGASGHEPSGGLPVLKVTGYGMNAIELDTNPILARRVVRDLNALPELDRADASSPDSFDAALCVVSIDYLTKPREVLASVLRVLKPGCSVHLAVSNRCFPTKAVARWLRVDEPARLQLVADCLWFSGFRQIEILTLVDNSVRDGADVRHWFSAMKDPLWVVRGRKPE